ncbi:type III pantothenate kinase [Neolewinella agarilytica]|uniref:type III pantothenate kinase n=1 Tax=Neolewinella agarilytica TaxID=478744 RepID=UPI0023578AB9|nr:type III pantothenate kinase [Neolewinella agarilytica]
MGTATNHHLVIDIGNTVAKAAVFLDKVMIGPVIRFSDQEWEEVDRLVTNHGVKKIIYSTVANVPPAKWIDKWESGQCLVLALGPDLVLPFSSVYTTMETLGQDRIAVVAGSMAIPTTSAPCGTPQTSALPARLIVDAGTCVTFDLIDGSATYLGGNISPGMRMRLQAMHTFTARLPDTPPADPSGRVGWSTASALRHGGQLGVVYETEGLFLRLQKQYPDLELLLTGGDANFLAGKLSVPFSLHPNLVLSGLNQILSNYVQNES